MNVSILHSKYEYAARSGSRLACFSHRYIMWCPLTTGIVASQCPLSQRTLCSWFATYTPLISIFKSVKKNSSTIKHIHKWRILTFTRWIWKCYNCDSDWSVGACCYNALWFMRTVRQIPRPNSLGIWLPVCMHCRALWQQTPSELVFIP